MNGWEVGLFLWVLDACRRGGEASRFRAREFIQSRAVSNHQERDAWIRERQEAGTSLKEIAVACGMSVNAVQDVLRKLQANGVAVRISKLL